MLRYLGGRILAGIKSRMVTQVIKLQDYFNRQSETSPLHWSVRATDHATPLALRQREYQIYHHIDVEQLQAWLEKLLHGRRLNEINQATHRQIGIDLLVGFTTDVFRD